MKKLKISVLIALITALVIAFAACADNTQQNDEGAVPSAEPAESVDSTETPSEEATKVYEGDRLEFATVDGSIVFHCVPNTYDRATGAGILRITRLDSLGETIWSKDYPDFYMNSYSSFSPFANTKDDGFVTVLKPKVELLEEPIPEDDGWDGSIQADKNRYLAKFDKDGNIIWQVHHNSSVDEIDLIAVDEGGSIYAYGHMFGYDSGDDTIILQKFDENGKLMLHKNDNSADWCQNIHYHNGTGWIVA